jgi:hypothetical protein
MVQVQTVGSLYKRRELWVWSVDAPPLRAARSKQPTCHPALLLFPILVILVHVFRYAINFESLPLSSRTPRSGM